MALNAHITSSGQGPLTVRLPSEAEWEYAPAERGRLRASTSQEAACYHGPKRWSSS